MKEKKSNLKNKEVLQDEQTSSIIRLIGLFMIVYGILCFTSRNMGCILSVPFTFLFGSFAPVVLAVMVFLGVYMLLFKKVFIGNNCVIKNSIILNDVYIGDNTVIENCIVESRATIRANTTYIGQTDDIRVIVEENERYTL